MMHSFGSADCTQARDVSIKTEIVHSFSPLFLEVSFVRSFLGPHGQTHTHKPRKGVRGRRSHLRLSGTEFRERGFSPVSNWVSSGFMI